MLIPKAAWILRFATELHNAKPDVKAEVVMQIATESYEGFAHLTPEEAVALYLVDMPPNSDDGSGDA